MAVITDYDAVRIGSIKDLEKRNDLILANTSQDLDAIAEYTGKPKLFKDFGGCFLKVEDGDYKEIYCYEGTIPFLDKDIYKIIPIIKPDVGDKVKLRPDVLLRNARSVPAHMGFTHEQFEWRKKLGKLEGKTGKITRIFPNSKNVNVVFPDGNLIGIDYTELELASND